jgi:hypothetical protein
MTWSTGSGRGDSDRPERDTALLLVHYRVRSRKGNKRHILVRREAAADQLPAGKHEPWNTMPACSMTS